MKLTAAQTRMLLDIRSGRDPYGRSTASNRMFERLRDDLRLIGDNPLALTAEGEAALRLAGVGE